MSLTRDLRDSCYRIVANHPRVIMLVVVLLLAGCGGPDDGGGGRY